jgi:hypothetical protein
MPHKTFFRQDEQLKPVAVGFGACIASDRIMIEGALVGYCYRQQPDTFVDSGWRFFAGDETQEYADDPEHFAYYDINTVANYDPNIAAILESPLGSAFERCDTGAWLAVDRDDDEP